MNIAFISIFVLFTKSSKIIGKEKAEVKTYEKPSPIILMRGI